MLVAEDEERVAEARTRLARVGLENVAGYLAGGIRAWDAGGPAARADGADRRGRAARRASREGADLAVVDVRRPAEWQAGHIAQAVSMPLHELAERAASLDRDRPVAAICAGGYRSSIATSVLERLGFRKVINVVGGMAAWNAAKYEVGTRRAGGRMRRMTDRRSGSGSSARVLASRPRSGAGAEGAGSVWESRKSAWEQLAAGQKDEVFRFAEDYKSYLKVSRSALTSTREVMRLAKAAGFAEFTDADQVKPGARLIVNAHDRAVILVVVGSEPIVSGSRVIGTHHDSPHIDLKARPIYAVERVHALQDDLLRRHQEVPVGQPRRSP